jgi:hypothetical protein
MEEKNYISNFDCSLWQIDDWGLYTAKSPIYINSLGSDFNVWFDVDGESFPTDKQLVAWAGFCNINSNEIKEMMIDGLTKLVDKMDVLPNDVEPEFGPIYRPMAISRNAKRSIEAVRHSRKTLGKVLKMKKLSESALYSFAVSLICSIIALSNSALSIGFG